MNEFDRIVWSSLFWVVMAVVVLGAVLFWWLS